MKPADVERIWYAGEPPPLWMRALVPVYRLLASLAGVPYRLGWRKPVRLPLPVVIIGNLTAGGTGKTPLVLALVDALRTRGLRPGVASRGYGGRAKEPMLLGDDPDPLVAGDEPALIRRRSGAAVAIGRDRVAAARLLLASGVDVILADDGLQNPSLARDIEVCVIDGQRRFGNGRLLPAGPLREPVSRMQGVDFVVCNGGTAHSDEVPMKLAGPVAIRLAAPHAERALSGFAGQRIHAVAGIGNPQRFFDSLARCGIDVIPHAFPDHHALQRADLEFADDLPVLMTEKDAVKCRAFVDLPLWQVPVGAVLPESFLDDIARRVHAVAAEQAAGKTSRR
ncbi:MAG TPA: tetraacyldisaccharide 4'-kinase [Dokdonella sp.]|jgi:tetraacyldisaccharide 4'-kinase|nr:tetraacyldisaccharide 4'-kinase [Dokdonella sp.]